MKEAVNIITLAIPVFFLLIGVEILIGKLRKTGYYRLNDAISNLNAGITEQVTGAFLKLIVVGIYAWLYENYRLTSVPENIVTWILLFLGVDFFYYWFHRYAHEINFLWGGHVVHHQSEEYNLSVALRQGAFQKFGSFLFYLPLAFFGFDPVMFIMVSQVQTLYQFWIHTKAINKLPAPVELIFNTPSHHRVHHGRNPKYIDRNHGGTLIIWDRFFGTFQEEEEPVVYGITKPLQTWNPIKAQLSFWEELIQNIRKTGSFGNKIKLLFYPPGWFPPELGGPIVPQTVTPEIIIKYQTALPARMNMYVFLQFAVILSFSSVLLFSFDAFDLRTNIIFAVLVLFSITSIGGVLESRRWSFYAEIFRLLSYPIFYADLIYYGLMPREEFAFYALAAYGIISVLFLFTQRKQFTQ